MVKKIAANKNYKLAEHKKIAASFKYKKAGLLPSEGPARPKRSRMPGTGALALDQTHKLWALYINYKKMVAANTYGSDKYFHCLGHCRAVSDQWAGQTLSQIVGWAREASDVYRKGDDDLAVAADYLANEHGRISKLTKGDCSDCWEYIPNGLSEEHWVYPKGMSFSDVLAEIETRTRWNEEYVRLLGDNGQLDKIFIAVKHREQGRPIPRLLAENDGLDSYGQLTNISHNTMQEVGAIIDRRERMTERFRKLKDTAVAVSDYFKGDDESEAQASPGAPE